MMYVLLFLSLVDSEFTRRCVKVIFQFVVIEFMIVYAYMYVLSTTRYIDVCALIKVCMQ